MEEIAQGGTAQPVGQSLPSNATIIIFFRNGSGRTAHRGHKAHTQFGLE